MAARVILPRMATKPKAKKRRNSPDLTLRNLRAMKQRMDYVENRLWRVENVLVMLMDTVCSPTHDSTKPVQRGK